MYKIFPYTRKQASHHNVQVKPSTDKRKKIDVFKNGVKIASVGAIGYKDYPTYMAEKGKAYADKRRELYRSRHRKNINVANSNGYWAGVLLW